MRKYGFTLVEVLFVVIIAAGVLAFAVPSYRKVKERSTYNAALGTLLDISNAVSALRQDLKLSTGQSVIISDSYIVYGSDKWPATPTFPGTYDDDKTWNENVASQSGVARTKAFTWALVQFGYLKPLPKKSTTTYDFYILEPNHTDSSLSKCLVSGQRGIACMYRKGKNLGGLAGNDCYGGAVVLPDGTIKRFKGSDCQD